MCWTLSKQSPVCQLVEVAAKDGQARKQIKGR
jgi:hypothetical protein